MKKLITSGCFLGIVFGSLFSQVDINSTSAGYTKNGALFYDGAGTGFGYQVPKGTGKNLIYTAGIWMGGYDDNQNLKFAGTHYGSGSDFWSGPHGGSFNSTYNNNFVIPDWLITKDEILFHISNYNSSSYTMPNSILKWPAHGDTSVGMSYYIAPFVDVNNNGKYEPQLGDYPKIRGDKAAFILLCDEKSVHSETGGGVINAEVHIMIYQYESTNFLDSTTFFNIQVFNRGIQELFDFRVGLFCDGDLGNPIDDYTGCDTLRHLMYMYNGDNLDEGNDGYGINPPAFGIVSLNHPMDHFISFAANATFPLVEPSPGFDGQGFYNVLDGRWPDGVPLTQGGNGYGGTTAASHMFPSNPNLSPGGTSYWAEEGNNVPGDRRMVMSVPKENFLPNTSKCYDFAVVYDRSGNRLQNVNGMLQNADSVRTFYDQQSFNCEQNYLQVENLSPEKLSIFPNPTSGDFSINLEKSTTGIITISDLLGRVIHTQVLNGESNVKINIKAKQGNYIVQLTTDKGKFSKSLVIQE